MHTLRTLIAMAHNNISGGTLPPGAVAMWKFENNLNDEAGANNATGNGSGLAYVAGKVGQALQYSGSGYASIPAINVGSAWTLDFYWKPRATISGGGAQMFGGSPTVANLFGGVFGANWSAAPADNGFNYRQNSSLRFGISLDSDARCVMVGQWYKIRFRYNGTTLYCYVNNFFFGSYTGTQNWNQIAQFGNVPGQSPSYSSEFDEIVLYNTDLGAPVTSGNLWCSFDCASNADIGDWGWNAWTNGSESYADGSDGTPNHAWNHANSANDVRTLHSMKLGNTWSIEMDLYWSNTSGVNGGILTRVSSSDGLILTTGGALMWRESGTNYLVSSTGFVVNNTWVAVKVTYDGSKVRMYKNGSLFATESGTHSRSWVPTTMGQVTTGTDPFGSGRFIGRIDNLKLYNAVV